MRRITTAWIVAAAAFAMPYGAMADGLVPEYCTLGERPEYSPIKTVQLSFDGAIGCDGDTEARILSGSETVATGKIVIENISGHGRTRGLATILFEQALVLPKGKEYRLVVPEGCLRLESDESVTNGELNVDFAVPPTLGEGRPSVIPGTVIEKGRRIGFYFGTETAPVEGGSVSLLREGVPVRTLQCDVSWDWDLGYAGIDFGEEIRFEDGVEYTVILPSGSVSALHRPDITNEEMSVSFIGGYPEPAREIGWVWCSLFDGRPEDGRLGEVFFHYDIPVVLSGNPVIGLYEGAASEHMVMEVVPTLTEEDGIWVLAADFCGYSLNYENAYSVVINEGTVVSASGDVIVNARDKNLIGGSVSVESSNVEADVPADTRIYDLHGREVVRPQRGGIYIHGGRKLVWQ